MDVFGLAWVCHKELPILNQQYVKTKWWYDNDFSCVYVDNHRSNKYFKGNSQSFQNMVFRLRVNEWMCFFNWIFLKIKWLFSVSEMCPWYYFLKLSHCVKSVCIRNSSGPYFPHLDWIRRDTYSVQMWQNTDQKNSKYGHFSRSVRGM